MTQELFCLIIAIGLALFSVWAYRRVDDGSEWAFILCVFSGLVSAVILIVLSIAYLKTLPTAWPDVWSGK